jgi:cell division protein FtsW
MNEQATIKQSPFTGIGAKTKATRLFGPWFWYWPWCRCWLFIALSGLLAYKYNKGNTEVYLFKQIAFIAVGMAVIYFSHRVNYTLYSRVARILFLISIPLLIYTLFFGVRINEGSRWIRLPIINLTFQTSDLAKLALFMYLSRLLSKKQD